MSSGSFVRRANRAVSVTRRHTMSPRRILPQDREAVMSSQNTKKMTKDIKSRQGSWAFPEPVVSPLCSIGSGTIRRPI